MGVCVWCKYVYVSVCVCVCVGAILWKMFIDIYLPIQMKGSNFSSMTFKIRKVEVVWQSLLFSWKPVKTIFEININSIKSFRRNIGKHQLKIECCLWGDRFQMKKLHLWKLIRCDGFAFALFI